MTPPHENNQPISLLCVDDDTWVLDLLKNYFSHEPDISLFTCTSGPEALTLIQQYQFDAIIADYSMPEINGITLLKEIRSQNDPAFFIMFTGRHLAQVAIETLNNGGNYYVQKGVDIQHELPRMLEFIRTSVKRRRREFRPADSDAWYRSVVEHQQDLLCSFYPDGRIALTNEPFTRFFNRSFTPEDNFFQKIPPEERDEVIRIIRGLTPDNPGTYIEHHTLTPRGTSSLYQWGYRAFFDEHGAVTELLAQGRDLAFVVRLSEILPQEAGQETSTSGDHGIGATPAGLPATPEGLPATPDYSHLAGSIELLQYPIFVIDKAGIVVAWNSAIAELTGIAKETIIGKGDYAYSFPLYGEPKPMLIDYVINPPFPGDTRVFPNITRDGDSFSADVEELTIRGQTVKVWGKATPISDASGRVIAAVQSLIVSGAEIIISPDATMEHHEHYIGGVSSIILKVAGEGLSGSIAGAIGSTTGGYGVYATDQRLIVIHNPHLDATRDTGVQFGEFLVNELFGTNVDMRPRAIADLERDKVYEVWRRDIAKIEMKTPRLFAGFLVIHTINGASFRIYVDHKKAFTHLEQLLKLFYPDIIQSATAEIDDAELEWLDEIRTLELVDRLKLTDPFEGISNTLSSTLPVLSALPQMPETASLPVTPDRWETLNQSVRKVPYPIFGIDLHGNVIAWNDAMATLTGINAREMIGKGDHEYALPFYGIRKHMLVDYIVMPPDAVIPGEIPAITREGDTFFGSLESVTIGGKSMLMWGKCTGIYDAKGTIIGSIQSILVSEQPSIRTVIGIVEEEQYIGGLSSITVKLPGDGVSGAIAGAIGSTTGGYGVYLTDQRLFIIHNRYLDATNPQGVQFGTFILDELFGTTVDTTTRSIDDLVRDKVYEIARKDILTLEMKRPLLFAGFIHVRTKNGENVRIYIDHKKAFIHLDQLLRVYYPEILRIG